MSVGADLAAALLLFLGSLLLRLRFRLPITLTWNEKLKTTP